MKSILILGNGPSTRELSEKGFDRLRSDIDTFGMGIAYRFFRQVNWWPTYYALGDSKVVFSHRKQLAQVVEDPNIPTERFFLSWRVSEHPRLEQIHHCSTGDFCLRKSLELRYRNIYLIGIEGQYVEEIQESRPLSGTEYDELGFDQLNLSDSLRKTLRIISKTPEHNPNYFFPGYQQQGDVYSLPQSEIHRDRWREAAELAESTGARIVNLSVASRICDFPRSSLSNFASRLLSSNSASQSQRKTDSRGDAVNVDQSFDSTRLTKQTHPPVWFGPFDREFHKQVDEARIVQDLFESAPPVHPTPVMVDVGACLGGTFQRFAKTGWAIHGFEPNPPLFNRLVRKFRQSNVTLNNLAVSDQAGEEVPFYTSDESIGISSLKPFRTTHEVTAKVKTIKLDNYLDQHGVNRIEFLKIDTEGFDLMVLKGLDLVRHPVDVILCEFEDFKTKPLGYSTRDLAGHLSSFGYTIYVSEWHPIIRYGGFHQWRALKRFSSESDVPSEPEDPEAWGNLLAFKSDPGIWAVAKAFNKNMRSFEQGKAYRRRKLQNRQRNANNDNGSADDKAQLRSLSPKRNTLPLRKVKRAVERTLERAFKLTMRQVFRNQ